jgi:hypothetical protein
MKASIGSGHFNQSKIVYLKLNMIHAELLDWLVYFAHSGKQKIIDTKKDYEHYYWVKYSKVFEDLPGLPFHSNQKLNKVFEELAGQYSNDPENYPLIKTVKNTTSGRQVGFALRENVLSWLRESGEVKVDSLITGNPIEKVVKSKTPKLQKHSVNQSVLSIFRTVTDFELDGKKLFPHGMPVDKHHFTTIYSNFQDKVLALYEGRFLTKYPLFGLKDWFKQVYKEYLLEDKITEKIHECKGSWINIEKLLTKSIKTYLLWFDPDTIVYDKNKLPRNVNDYIYNPFNGCSMFYVTMLMGPAYQRDESADKIYHSIPKEVRSLFMPFYDRDKTDNFTFWTKVRSINKYYDDYRNDLCNDDTNCLYWFGRDKEEWIGKYVGWMRSWIDTITVAHLGTGNRTWAEWLRYARETHDIEINLPRK